MHEEFDSRQKLISVEQARYDKLINNMLPSAIAERLKTEKGMIADNYDSVTVLFADIVGFTELSSHTSPKELVDILNVLFYAFDCIAEKYHLEKIKTIGDSYMVAAGIPIPCENHAHHAVKMALDILDEVRNTSILLNEYIDVRIGINSGPVVAGVIGLKKSIYDLWGDTVNVASRMESTGIPGKIHVSEKTYELLQGHYQCYCRGMIPVKGKGYMKTYVIENF